MPCVFMFRCCLLVTLTSHTPRFQLPLPISVVGRMCPRWTCFSFWQYCCSRERHCPRRGREIFCRFPSDSQCTIFFSYLYAKDQFMSCHPFELCMGISGMVYSTQMPVDAAFCRGEGIWGVGGKFLPCNSLWVMIKVVGTCFLS